MQLHCSGGVSEVLVLMTITSTPVTYTQLANGRDWRTHYLYKQMPMYGSVGQHTLSTTIPNASDHWQIAEVTHYSTEGASCLWLKLASPTHTTPL